MLSRQTPCADLGGADWDGTRAHRQLELERKYKFRCTCPACGLSGDALTRSEARRRRMIELHRETMHNAPPDITACVAELCDLAEAEGLPEIWQRAAVIAAMRHAKEVGDAAAAVQWAKRGARIARLALGDDAPTTVKFDMVVKAWTTAVAMGTPLPG